MSGKTVKALSALVQAMPKPQETDERADERKRDKQARLDELGNIPGQIGTRSAVNPEILNPFLA